VHFPGFHDCFGDLELAGFLEEVHPAPLAVGDVEGVGKTVCPLPSGGNRYADRCTCFGEDRTGLGARRTRYSALDLCGSGFLLDIVPGPVM
jgi:hypothetical protein